MDIFLQVWGGTFYLLAKIFLSYAEGKQESKNLKWRKYGWIAYLIGVLPWVILLASNHNWIAMAIEIGGVPSMILGFIFTTRKLSHARVLLEQHIKVFIYILVITGIIYSLYDFNGITTISQILECGIMIGFLMGTYLLAKKDRKGWLYFMVMNINMAILMAMQEKWILSFLQIVSLGFVIYGFLKSKKT